MVHRFRLLQIGVALFALVVGGYLLLWAYRWPHADLRNVWAVTLGVVTAGLGLVAGLAAVRVRSVGWRFTALVGTAIVVTLAVVGFGVVTSGQDEACSEALAECSSLLPGF